jgi:FMN phosphatase YigB (HAD superfamily)
MYRHASDALGLRPEECLFVDDDPELVAAAVELGYVGRAMCPGDGAESSPRVPSITALPEILDLF